MQLNPILLVIIFLTLAGAVVELAGMGALHG